MNHSNLETIVIPERLARRPRDRRGFPIPFTVLMKPDGTPDFRVTDMTKWSAAIKTRVCALCGEPLGRHLAFVGGPNSHDSRYFTDLPMHLECARYAVQVCPFIAAPNYRYAESIKTIEGVTMGVNDEVSTERPERFFIGTTKNYRVVQTDRGAVVVKAEPWESVEWWRHGMQLEGVSG